MYPTIIFLLSLLWSTVYANDGLQKVGAGGWRLQASSGDRPAPNALYRSQQLLNTAAPTNQWYSSVMFTRWSEVIHSHPLSLKATESGMEIGLPRKTIIPTERKDVEVDYTHEADILVSAAEFQADGAFLAGRGDWSVDISLENKQDRLLMTTAHGSPFVYGTISKGDILIKLNSTFQTQVVDHTNLLITQANKQFMVFAPMDAKWEKLSPQTWKLHLPMSKGFFSIAYLPNTLPNTLEVFKQSAFAFITNTKVSYQVDRSTGLVHTHFVYETKAMEGQLHNPIIGLYPHQYHLQAHLPVNPIGTAPSIRGAIRLFQANTFSTTLKYHGFVPFWPNVSDQKVRTEITDQLKKEASRARRMMLEIGNGVYWQGKGLQRISQLMQVAEITGEITIRDNLLKMLKQRMQEWLSGTSKKTYFHYDPSLGTVVGYPEEYDSVKDMNDHHFHYGYWIRAAAEIGMRDAQWMQSDQWGGMINLLIKDIASTQRGQKDFPFLRNFDPYEGHSWASGVALSPHGNNQESSSEAVNAWASLILWGELTDNPELTDLGIYLYVTEINSIMYYWFDVYGMTLPKEYLNAEVSMLFGGKLAHNTWWIDEPRQIHGINLLPITPSSTYLGLYPEFVKKNLATLKKDIEIYQNRGKRANPADIWQDIFAQYLALVDPLEGMKAWDAWGSVELGNTRTNALFWLQSLVELGTPDYETHANTVFYAVFKKPDGSKTYLAYNPKSQAQEVVFNDGTKLRVEPKSLGKHSGVYAK
ncbi:MAG: glycosyl hydrolase [Gammaproteobacteria bacterium]|nr:glycosyl hydrolase [Gammaproteobacteria bacterium]